MSNRWPARALFLETATRHREKAGISQAEQADLLGISHHTLKTYLYGKLSQPSLDVLQRAAALFGVSVTDFIDDPNAQMAGLGAKDMSELSAAKRAAMQMVFQDFKHPEMTDEQAIGYARAFDAMVAAGLGRKGNL